MILDALTKVSAAQQVTADAVSTSSYDCGNITPKRKMGVGRGLVAVVCITAIGTNTGSTKLQVIQSAAAALTSPQILGEIDLATADIAAGKIYIIPIGAGIPGLRYLGVNHDITGTVDYTVDTYITSREDAGILADTYAKGYAV